MSSTNLCGRTASRSVLATIRDSFITDSVWRRLAIHVYSIRILVVLNPYFVLWLGYLVTEADTAVIIHNANHQMCCRR
jgi:hypothetical protein